MGAVASGLVTRSGINRPPQLHRLKCTKILHITSVTDSEYKNADQTTRMVYHVMS